MIRMAVSPWDVETLIRHPASTSHSTYTPQECARHGMSDAPVPLFVGV
ncbi:MAG: PLP-dependent transferase [Rhodobacter sp.]|nr:PLP-dependent transferase [Rhodobacter sp.]